MKRDKESNTCQFARLTSRFLLDNSTFRYLAELSNKYHIPRLLEDIHVCGIVYPSLIFHSNIRSDSSMNASTRILSSGNLLPSTASQNSSIIVCSLGVSAKRSSRFFRTRAKAWPTLSEIVNFLWKACTILYLPWRFRRGGGKEVLRKGYIWQRRITFSCARVTWNFLSSGAFEFLSQVSPKNLIVPSTSIPALNNLPFSFCCWQLCSSPDQCQSLHKSVKLHESRRSSRLKKRRSDPIHYVWTLLGCRSCACAIRTSKEFNGCCATAASYPLIFMYLRAAASRRP